MGSDPRAAVVPPARPSGPGRRRSLVTLLDASGDVVAVLPAEVRWSLKLTKPDELVQVRIPWEYLLSDGTLLYGEYAEQFGQALRQAYPKVEILLWLRMTAEQIANADQREEVVALARTSVHEWKFDGVQLNGFGVVSQSESYIALLRALGEALGEGVLLSVTVPPDRIPADPDVPASPAGVPELTWDVGYKQQVGLLNVDEAVIMAHASGLKVAAESVSYTHLRAHETVLDFVCRLLLEKKNKLRVTHAHHDHI